MFTTHPSLHHSYRALTIAQLAIVGWFFPEIVYHLPNDIYSAVNPLEAPAKVGWGPCLQIILGIAFLEAAAWEKVYSGNAGGDYGFDPLGLAKSPAARKRMQLAEIKNGRLAMCAIGGGKSLHLFAASFTHILTASFTYSYPPLHPDGKSCSYSVTRGCFATRAIGRHADYIVSCAASRHVRTDQFR